jgi:quercetin dioxygenase-like cupin family protein
MELAAMQLPVSLEAACGALPELWSPRVVGQVNDQYVKVARVHGEFPWHAHAFEDEMFLVLRGALRIGRAEADGGDVLVRAGEFFVVPRGVRHNTSAAEETWIALIETVTTEHTGGEKTPMTRSIVEQLGERRPGGEQGAGGHTFEPANVRQGLKPSPHGARDGTAEAVPLSRGTVAQPQAERKG